MTNARVLVAMSGGVDSSVAAYLLLQQGYACEGATMRLACSQHFGNTEAQSCSSVSDVEDARTVCKRLGISHRVLDMHSIFKRSVVDKFIETYKDGRTPNPCIDCNRNLKFGALLDYALDQGFDYIATGHYAQIVPEKTNSGTTSFALKCGVDHAKDQSYVLYSLTQERLAHVLLPLGGLIKERDVRAIAEAQGFGNAKKPDSQGICFVPDNDFASFIEQQEGRPLPEGDIVDTKGQVLGHHQGAIRYTIGQRKGLGVALLHPVYVCAIDAQANTVTLGEEADLMASGLLANDWIWSAPKDRMETALDKAGFAGVAVHARIRYHQPAQPAHLSWDYSNNLQKGSSDVLKVTFDQPQRAIAPGQAVVIYDNDVVLGGGTTLQAI